MGSIGSNAVTSIQHLLAESGLVQTTDRQGAVIAFDQAMEHSVSMILGVRSARRKVMVIGNGGSAAIASHMQTDLSGSLGTRGLIFNEPSLITALSNDHGYEHAFERLVNLWADPGDLMVAISSSGKSANILNACQTARERGSSLITFSGFSADNPLRTRGDINVYVACPYYGPVESSHQMLIHHLTDRILTRLASEATE
jgi:D-sedoheptulose 7-phosphate isomerase